MRPLLEDTETCLIPIGGKWISRLCPFIISLFTRVCFFSLTVSSLGLLSKESNKTKGILLLSPTSRLFAAAKLETTRDAVERVERAVANARGQKERGGVSGSLVRTWAAQCFRGGFLMKATGVNTSTNSYNLTKSINTFANINSQSNHEYC